MLAGLHHLPLPLPLPQGSAGQPEPPFPCLGRGSPAQAGLTPPAGPDPLGFLPTLTAAP